MQPKPPSVWQPALTAGFIFGFVSGIPLVGALNCMCCSLILGAGVTCSYLMVRSSSIPLTVGRSAMGGALTGMFAALIWVITYAAISIILGGELMADFDKALERAAEINPEAREAARVLSGVGAYVMLSIMLVLAFFFYTIFGILGGIIGRAIFERRPPVPEAGAASPMEPMAPPPPPSPPDAPLS